MARETLLVSGFAAGLGQIQPDDPKKHDAIIDALIPRLGDTGKEAINGMNRRNVLGLIAAVAATKAEMQPGLGPDPNSPDPNLDLQGLLCWSLVSSFGWLCSSEVN